MQSETPPQRVADRIKAELRNGRISQEVLGQRLKVSQQAISRRLTGEVEFSISELHEVAKVLGTTSIDLLTPHSTPLLDAAAPQAHTSSEGAFFSGDAA